MRKFFTILVVAALSACASRPTPAPQAPAKSPFGELVLANSTTKKICPKDKAGQACRMTFAQAEKYCASQGTRLPTTREFASYSQSKGAKGLREIPAAERAQAPAKHADGAYKVDSINPGHQLDSFYFDHTGYDAQAGGLGQEQLWTSSQVVKHPGYAHVFYGAWGGGGGKPPEHAQTFRNSVRCLAK